jgi:hypothetical protein
MSTPILIPQTSQNFGKVNKIIWFNVSDVDGTFSLNLHITPSQVANTTISIFNQGNKIEVFNRTYIKSSNNDIINETVKIRHTPGLDSNIYGIKTI